MASNDADTREEVEALLKNNEERMSRRIETIESQLPGGEGSAISSLRKAISWKKGLFIGTGLLVGIILIRKRRSRVGYDEGLRRVSEGLAQEVRRQLKSGKDVEEAVESAVEKRPPILKTGPARGIISVGVTTFLQTAAGILATHSADRFMQRINRRASESQDSEPFEDEVPT